MSASWRRGRGDEPRGGGERRRHGNCRLSPRSRSIRALPARAARIPAAGPGGAEGAAETSTRPAATVKARRRAGQARSQHIDGHQLYVESRRPSVHPRRPPTSESTTQTPARRSARSQATAPIQRARGAPAERRGRAQVHQIAARPQPRSRWSTCAGENSEIRIAAPSLIPRGLHAGQHSWGRVPGRFLEDGPLETCTVAPCPPFRSCVSCPEWPRACCPCCSWPPRAGCWWYGWEGSRRLAHPRHGGALRPPRGRVHPGVHGQSGDDPLLVGAWWRSVPRRCPC